MAQGLQVFNEDGTIRDDITTRFARLLKKVYIPPAAVPRPSGNGYLGLRAPISKGSFEVPEFAEWSPFYFFTKGTYLPKYYPDIRIVGTTVNWEFFPDADMGTFCESNMVSSEYVNNKNIYYVGGFWINIGVY